MFASKNSYFTGAAAPVWTAAIPNLVSSSNAYNGMYATTINKFIVGAGTGTLLSTSDYQTYTTLATGLAATPLSIAYTGSLYVAVCTGGVILTSPDLTSWTSRTSGTAQNFFKVVWNGSILVATGAAGTIVTSPDGITWTTRTSALTLNLNSCVWNGSIFFVNEGGTKGVTSSDGITWSSAITLTGQTTALRATWTGSLFVLVGSSGIVTTSPDGTTWTTRTSPTAQTLQNVSANGSTVLSVGSNGTVIYSSDGGITWASKSTGASNGAFLGLTWSNDRFVFWGNSNNYFYSYDGTVSYISSLPNSGVPLGTFGYNSSNATFGIGLYGSAASSSNKINWKASYTGTNGTVQHSTSTYVSALGLWFLTTSGGALRTSPDYVTWTSQTTGGPSAALRGFAWNGTTLVGAFSASGILTSTNGTSWTYTANAAAGVAPIWTGTQFVIIGSTTGNILTSPDGTTWTTRTSVYTGGALQALTWTGSLIVGVGLTGNIATSPDGITWTTRTSGTATATFYGVDAGGGYVWAVGSDTVGIVYKSTDGGVTWTNDTTIPASVGSTLLVAVKCGSGTSVVVGGRSGSVNGYLMYR